MKLKHLIAPILALGLCAGITSAHATDPPTRVAQQFAPIKPPKSWTGCTLAVMGGMAAMDTKAGVSAPGLVPPGWTSATLLELDGIAATGFSYGGDGTCDLQVFRSFVVGAIASYNRFHDADWNLNIVPGAPGGGINFNTGLDKEWSIGVRVGYLPTSSTLLYGLIAYSQLDMNAFSGKAVGTPLGSLATPTFTGIQLGAGVEHRFSDAWFTRLEYRYGQYDAESVAIGTTGLNLDVDPTTHSARLGIGYRFGVFDGTK